MSRVCIYFHLLLGDVQAVYLMYYGGDLAEVLLAVVLLTFWLRKPVERREGLFKSAERGVSRVRITI